MELSASAAIAEDIFQDCGNLRNSKASLPPFTTHHITRRLRFPSPIIHHRIVSTHLLRQTIMSKSHKFVRGFESICLHGGYLPDATTSRAVRPKTSQPIQYCSQTRKCLTFLGVPPLLTTCKFLSCVMPMPNNGRFLYTAQRPTNSKILKVQGNSLLWRSLGTFTLV